MSSNGKRSRNQLRQIPRKLWSRCVLALESAVSYPVGRVQYATSRIRRRRHDERYRNDENNRRAFAYDKRLLPNSYVADCEQETPDLENAQRITGLSVGYPAWNLLYYTLLTHLNVKNRKAVILETGTNKGFSTIMLAQALKDSGNEGVVHTIDIDADLVNEARGHVERAGLDDVVRFHTGDSLIILREILAEESHVDFAFLDGCHLFKHVRKEFKLLYPKVVACRGIVYFDNISSGEVGRAIRWIKWTYGGNSVDFMNCSWGRSGQMIWQSK